MRKSTVWWIVCSVLVLGGLTLILCFRLAAEAGDRSVAVLGEYHVRFGDTPRAVERKIQHPCLKKERLSYSTETWCRYELDVLGAPAEMDCYYYNGRILTQVDIRFPKAEGPVDALFERAKAAIQKHYKDNELFFCEDIVYEKDGAYRQSLGVDDGAVGTLCTLDVRDSTLSISCIDSR